MIKDSRWDTAGGAGACQTTMLTRYIWRWISTEPLTASSDMPFFRCCKELFYIQGFGNVSQFVAEEESLENSLQAVALPVSWDLSDFARRLAVFSR